MAATGIERDRATIADGGSETRELTLFVSGASDLAARAIANARRLCDVHLHGRCHLSVVDVHEDPAAVLTSRLLATPTLVRNLPLPDAEGRRRPVGHRQGAPGAGPSARTTASTGARLDTCVTSTAPPAASRVAEPDRDRPSGPQTLAEIVSAANGQSTTDDATPTRSIRMAEAEDTLRAIGAGEVDAFVVSDGGRGQRVFTLSTADRPYRMFVENMRDGAATLSSSGLILYANRRLGGAAGVPERDDRGVAAGDVRGRRRSDRAGRDPRAGRARRHVEFDLVDANGVAVPSWSGARRSTSTATTSPASRSPTSAPRRPRIARSPGSARPRPSGWPTCRTRRRR